MLPLRSNAVPQTTVAVNSHLAISTELKVTVTVKETVELLPDGRNIAGDRTEAILPVPDTISTFTCTYWSEQELQLLIPPLKV